MKLFTRSSLLLFIVTTLIVSAEAQESKTAEKPRDYTSKAPRFTFANSLAEQEAQLKDNPLLLRFREARRKQADDPHAPRYHFSSQPTSPSRKQLTKRNPRKTPTNESNSPPAATLCHLFR